MGDELDTSVDTSIDTSSSDISDSGGFDDSVDLGGFMNDSADVGDFSNNSSDIESLMDAPSDVGSIIDDSTEFNDIADQPSDVVDSLDTSPDIEMLMDEPADLDPVADEAFALTDYHPDVESIADAPSQIESLMDEPPDVASAMDDVGDVEPYHATPNSDIPILQEDGSVDSLENIMAANEDTEAAPMDVEPYRATPNSENQILQEDGTVDTLENLMAASAETDEGAADSLEAIMNDSAELDSDGLEDPSMDFSPVADTPGTSEGDIAPVSEDISITGDNAADIGDSVEHITEPIHMSQSDVEMYIESATDAESLHQMRDGIASGRIQIDADTELPDDDAIDEPSGPVLVRDPNEQWEIGNHAIDDTIEAMRDDLRDKGIEDGPKMEAIVMAERARMQDELTRNINGDFSDPYQKPDFTELMQGNMSDVPAQDIPAVEQAADTVEATDVVTDVPQDINYDAVYSGLDSYDFDGIDYSSDVDRLDSSLDNFQNRTWENLSVDEQKAAMSDLADYVKDVIGFDNPPQVVYYNNPVDGDYGGYSPSTNTLEINEHMLYDNNEAADTIAHELWHAYQHERAMNPQSAKDYQYQYGFDNYIRPDDDFTAYQDQLVEAEARAFAQQFKDRLSTKRRSI